MGVSFPTENVATESKLVRPAVRAVDALTAYIPEQTAGLSINVVCEMVPRLDTVRAISVGSVQKRTILSWMWAPVAVIGVRMIAALVHW